MRYLLDTNSLSDVVRNPHGIVATHIDAVGEAEICISIIVAAELPLGSRKRRSARLTAQVEAVLSAIKIIPFQAPADPVYADIRFRLESAGTPIGENDLLIAAYAVALGCIVVTDNEGQFGRVGELKRENWLRQI